MHCELDITGRKKSIDDAGNLARRAILSWGHQHVPPRKVCNPRSIQVGLFFVLLWAVTQIGTCLMSLEDLQESRHCHIASQGRTVSQWWNTEVKLQPATTFASHRVQRLHNMPVVATKVAAAQAYEDRARGACPYSRRSRCLWKGQSFAPVLRDMSMTR
jgi:hypothetical protein